MNIAEAARMRELERKVADLQHEVANLKQIVECLTTTENPLKDREQLRLKKSG